MLFSCMQTIDPSARVATCEVGKALKSTIEDDINVKGQHSESNL